MMGNFGYGWGGCPGFFSFGFIFNIILWLLIVFVIVAIFKSFKKSKGETWENDHAPSHTPLDILKERYAKGEVDKRQFEEMKKDLK